MRNVTAWVLTDGKAGDEAQCLGLTERLGLAAERRHVRPRAPWRWLMPWGPIDPAEAADRPASPIRPPFPDLLVASGRRAIPYVRAVARASGRRTATVILKDPRTGTGAADLIWVPEHDRLRGANVLATPTSPHRLSPERLAAARAEPHPAIAALPPPRVAVLVGGDSRHHRFRVADVRRFRDRLQTLAAEGAHLMVGASRRTPPALREAAAEVAASTGGLFDDGSGESPYVAMLALADAIVVTADSVNMIGEAVATGAPVLIFTPSGGHPKLSAFVESLRREGIVRPFTGKLEFFTYMPVDSTPLLADAVRNLLAERGIV